METSSSVERLLLERVVPELGSRDLEIIHLKLLLEDREQRIAELEAKLFNSAEK